MTDSLFHEAHDVLSRHYREGRLAGVSTLVFDGHHLVDTFCLGYADREAGVALRPDHIHRAFSNTKLFTAVMTMVLVDEGHLALDAPVREWIPALAATAALCSGASTIDETEPLNGELTLRHLLTHTAGLSHGVFDPGSLLFEAYHQAGLRQPDTDLQQIAERLPLLPLAFQPGSGWEYSMAPDVLARVMEVALGQPFAALLQDRLLGPLGLMDTGYVLQPHQRSRLAALYAGDVTDPMVPGLRRLDSTPWPEVHLRRVPREGGASGLFTTQADMLVLLCALRKGCGGPVPDDLLHEMMQDQLPPSLCVRFPAFGAFPSLGFGLAGAVTRAASQLQPNTPAGEVQWGGLAGTHWAFVPDQGVALVLMAQRHMGFWNPYWFEWKSAVYAALK